MYRFILCETRCWGISLILTLGLSACGGGGGGSESSSNNQLPLVSVAEVSISEGNSGVSSIVFVVSLTDQANGDVNVDYATSDGSAIAGSDYVSISDTLIIPAGSTSAGVTVLVNGDDIYESNETFTLTLSNISANATLGTATATGTIMNDDTTGSSGTGLLNDTGITSCTDASSNGLDCPQSGYPGQDGEFGRDANGATNSDSDGHAGFSFTKVDANGQVLADQSADYATTPWSCIQDNVTGLMWEVKTDDGGLRDKNWTYSWYSSDGSTNGGWVGDDNDGSCYDGVNCDTEKHVAQVNGNEGLCGYRDWRIPTRKELMSLVDSGISSPGPVIDTRFFPNTSSSRFWSSSPRADSSARFVWGVNFNDGYVSTSHKSNPPHRVRLVRDGL